MTCREGFLRKPDGLDVGMKMRVHA